MSITLPSLPLTLPPPPTPSPYPPRHPSRVHRLFDHVSGPQFHLRKRQLHHLQVTHTPHPPHSPSPTGDTPPSPPLTLHHLQVTPPPPLTSHLLTPPPTISPPTPSTFIYPHPHYLHLQHAIPQRLLSTLSPTLSPPPHTPSLTPPTPSTCIYPPPLFHPTYSMQYPNGLFAVQGGEFDQVVARGMRDSALAFGTPTAGHVTTLGGSLALSHSHTHTFSLFHTFTHTHTHIHTHTQTH